MFYLSFHSTSTWVLSLGGLSLPGERREGAQDAPSSSHFSFLSLYQVPASKAYWVHADTAQLLLRGACRDLKRNCHLQGHKKEGHHPASTFCASEWTDASSHPQPLSLLRLHRPQTAQQISAKTASGWAGVGERGGSLLWWKIAVVPSITRGQSVFSKQDLDNPWEQM